MLCNPTLEVQEHWAASALPACNQQKIDYYCMSINHLIDLSLIFKKKQQLLTSFLNHSNKYLNFVHQNWKFSLEEKRSINCCNIKSSVHSGSGTKNQWKSLISKILCTFKFKSWSRYIINRSAQASTVRSNLHTYDGLASTWNKYSCAR